MSDRVSLHHKISYSYDRAVQLSEQVVRLCPAAHSRLPIIQYSLKIEPNNFEVKWKSDTIGNYVAHVVSKNRVDSWSIDVDLIVEISQINPFDFLLERYAQKFPFVYEQSLANKLGPFVSAQAGGQRLAEFVKDLATPQSTVTFLYELNKRVAEHIRHVVRDNQGDHASETTLQSRSGTTRDMNILLAEAVRHFGFAARFVSGYVFELKTGRDQGFYHLWTEVYLPGAGWIGFDPTSGLLVGGEHWPLAAGSDISSTNSVSGTVEKCNVQSHFEVLVQRINSTSSIQGPSGWPPLLISPFVHRTAFGSDTPRPPVPPVPPGPRRPGSFSPLRPAAPATKTVHVDLSAPNCFRTIGDAIAQAVDGNVIEVSAGLYSEVLVVPKRIQIMPRNPAERFVLFGVIEVTGPAANLELIGCDVQGPGAAGVTVSGRATLKSCTFSGATHGMEVKAGGSVECERCSFTGNSDAGVVIAGNCQLKDCKAFANKSSGIAVFTGGSLKASGCHLYENSGSGIWLNQNSSAKLENCDVHHNHNSGVKGTGGTAEILGCDIHDEAKQGLYLSGPMRGIVGNSKFRNNGENGIFVSSGAEATIENCRVVGSGASFPGIMVRDSSNCIVRKSQIQSCRSDGLHFKEQARGLIEDCESSQNSDAGITVTSRSDVAIHRSKAYENKTAGVYWADASRGRVEECEFWANETGVDILSGANPVLLNCRVHDNAKGVYAQSQGRGHWTPAKCGTPPQAIMGFRFRHLTRSFDAPKSTSRVLSASSTISEARG